MSLLKRLWLGLSGSANKRQVFDMALNCMLAGGVGAARGTHWLETKMLSHMLASEHLSLSFAENTLGK